MSNIWVSFDEFNVEHLVFEDIKATEKGGKSVTIKYFYTDAETGLKSTKAMPLKIYFPELKTWGAQAFDDSWYMNCYFDESTPKEMVALFQSLDERIIDYVQDKSKQLLGSVKSKDICREFMTKTLKQSVDKRSGEPKDNFFKIKLASYENKWNFLVCNESGTSVFSRDSRGTPDSVIPKFAKCEMIVGISSIWVTTNKFGYSIKLVQAGVSTVEAKVSLYETCVLPGKKAVVTKAPRRETAVTDTDDEEEAELEQPL